MPPTGLASGHPGVDVTPTYPPAQGGAGGAAACTGATGCFYETFYWFFSFTVHLFVSIT